MVLIIGVISGSVIMLATGATEATRLLANIGSSASGMFETAMVAVLVGAMDIATANNTVAIVMANPIAKEMAQDYNISPRKAASILDTFSCIFQGIIPYGAQMLVAISVAAKLECAVSAFDIIPHLIYPFMLLVSSLVFVFLLPESRKYRSQL